MKIVVTIIALLLLLTACQPQKAPEIIEVPEEPAIEPQESAEAVVVEETKPIEQEQGKEIPEDYLLGLNDRIEPYGVPVWFLDVRGDGLVKIDIDGRIWDFPTTKYMQIVSGLEITVIRIDYGKPDRLTSKVLLNVKKFEPKQGEHLMQLDRTIYVQNSTGEVWIELWDVEQDTQAIKIKTADRESIRIPEGETIKNMGLKITNVNTLPKPNRVDNYALIRVEKE